MISQTGSSHFSYVTALAMALTILVLCVGPSAHGYQGEMKSTTITQCGPQSCMRVESDSLSVDHTGRIMAGAKATVKWFDKKGHELKRLEVREPVLFLAGNMLTWEGTEQAPKTEGYTAF